MLMKRCNCGAEYPDGAEYCPNCGRPLTAAALEQERAENAFVREPRPSEASPELTVSFGNPQALRAAYWPAALAALLVILHPMFMMLCWVWYPAAGFSSVASYCKRTKSRISLAQGARLGWIAGVLTFTISLVLVALHSLIGPGFGQNLHELETRFRETGEVEAADGLARLAADPTMLVWSIVIFLVLLFIFATGLTTLGGALGARILRDD